MTRLTRIVTLVVTPTEDGVVVTISNYIPMSSGRPGWRIKLFLPHWVRMAGTLEPLTAIRMALTALALYVVYVYFWNVEDPEGLVRVDENPSTALRHSG